MRRARFFASLDMWHPFYALSSEGGCPPNRVNPNQVETLNSGCLARELFVRAALSGKSPFDLVIIDMLLNEELDGLEVFEQIQRLFPAQKAIVVSGHAPTERAELAVKKGLTWLAKPYNMEELAHAVQRVLRDDSIAARR